ncbi:hypothetical protein GOP47_0020225 [Adiantum capillus-veneris]|uniref:Uncharacterized protein n=1 Tax=Adiantum capillus-veneris TaxID=13818 RepID=A0A9D4Z990_ADICA|nr:hypothetical protein GOP47_0020225 [Adiantum capillus-veneris]
MERHLAWLLALIIVLTTWFALLCYGATVKKKASAQHRNTGSQSHDQTSTNSSNEQLNGATEPCSCNQTDELNGCRQTSCDEQSASGVGSDDAVGEMRIISIDEAVAEIRISIDEAVAVALAQVQGSCSPTEDRLPAFTKCANQQRSSDAEQVGKYRM